MTDEKLEELKKKLVAYAVDAVAVAFADAADAVDAVDAVDADAYAADAVFAANAYVNALRKIKEGDKND